MDRLEKEGTLVVPDEARENNTPRRSSGIVLLVGDDVKGNIKPLDVVLFGKYAGSDFSVDGNDVTILDEKEIMAICDDTQDATVTYLDPSEDKQHGDLV